MSYTELDAEAVQQLANTAATHHQRAHSVSAAERYRHEMRWVQFGDAQHLHKVDADTAVLIKDFGLRSEKLERLHDDYVHRQGQARAEWEAADRAHRRSIALNIEAGVVRVPDIVIGILDALARYGLNEHYLVIGTHALYAYEVAAGVYFDPPTMATNDVDLLWDVQKRMKLLQAMASADCSMIEVLQTVDVTFERMEDQKESAMNAEAFTVDFLRRREPEPFSPALCITEREGDIFPVQAERAQDFLSSPRFEQVVVGLNGKTSLLRTIDPKTFVDFKHWMSGLPTRDPLKRHRDKRQALAVAELLQAGKLSSKI